MEKAISEMNTLRYFLSICIVFAICNSNAWAERFIPKKALAYRVTDLNGCKIISLPKESSIPHRLRNDCQKAKVPNMKGDNSWHDYYSSIEISLGSALEISVRSLSKSLGIWPTQLTKGKDIHIALYHDPLANAGISEYDSYILIGINDGLVELIENTASALQMPSAAQNVKGINFVDWLELMRTPRTSNENRIISAGPDNYDTREKVFHAPTWFWSTRIKASILYQFIIGHELAHVHRGDLEGGFVVSLNREIACDKLSFDAFFANNDQEQAISVVMPFLISLWYYENYWDIEIRESGRTIIKNLHPDLFARNWKKRASSVLEQWPKVFGGKRGSLEAKKRFSKVLLGLRPPYNSNALSSRAKNKIRVFLKEVKFRRPPDDTNVDYSLVVVNADKYDSIKAVVEVQSRVFSRDKSLDVSPKAPADQKGKYYQVVDNDVYSLTIPPKSKKEFSGSLPWVGTKAVYPGISQRLVSAKYE